MGGAGWLASLFGFLFVLLLFEPDTPPEATVAGVILLGAGFGLYAADRDNAFFEQLALALSLAGQFALLYAVGEGTESATAVAGFATVLSVGVVIAMPNPFAKTLSALFACVAWALTVRFGVWGEDWFDRSRQAVAFVPALIGWLVIWIPVAAGVHVLIRREAEWMATSTRRMARPALTGLLIALAVGTWSSEPFAAFSIRAPGTEAATNWLAVWPLLGVAAALFAALCAFRLQHRAMLGVAIAGALLHVMQFYYLLGVSLVVKSYVMLAVGAGLLVAARRLRLGASTDTYAPSAPTPGRQAS
jgi:hypothetical protein